jgi:DNA-binding protein HU-beta
MQRLALTTNGVLMITSNSKSGFNKKDLTEQLAAKAGIPKSAAAKTINLFTSIISEALIDGKKVTISDFGTFNLSERSAFEGYDPQNDRRISVPPRVIPVFRAGKKLKQALNVLSIRSCTIKNQSEILIEFNHLTTESIEGCKDHRNYSILFSPTEQSSIKKVTAANLNSEVPSVVLKLSKPLRSLNFTVVATIPHIDLNNTLTSDAISFEVNS